MATQKKGKLNQLARILPEGLLVDAAWLEREGYSRALRSQYVTAGWLEQPARGVFRRSRGTVSWEQVVISLQTLLDHPMSVGGRTALELQGYAHYLSHAQKHIHLYSDSKLPTWLHKLPLEQRFVTHNRLRLLPRMDLATRGVSLEAGAPEEEAALAQGLRIMRWGQWNWPMVISTPERAYLELLDELPQDETFHMADVIMEGLGNLSPRRLQTLLEHVKSVKVKRLFFFFAQRHGHQWLGRINQDTIDLGRGKRVLAEGGRLDSQFLITVPKEFAEEESHGL
ncbi:type IV toxin-antitoxin system AbiEi family antitoxin domain-containing protein [Mangrovitalea sediminis]|uniref:type IV toxin-antitoxin system AbiEi family antitoxin domain-containing protein n=1 Tax=Mangrovitalea sediminis TaxID=1982043 RepID=UPI000BE62858|nr:type IV toxin-antitoxin system AbiEi family antitoxin domain-containing protein [Mangrovitalea sediminis]